MDDTTLDKSLASLGLSRANAALVAILPLIQVAWADGAVQPEERDLVRAIARRHGHDAAALTIVDRWLGREPPRDAFATAHKLVAALVDRTEPPMLAPGTLEEIVAHCGGVAEAAGGLFGYGKVSAAEKAALAQVARIAGPMDVDGSGTGVTPGDWTCITAAASPDDVSLWTRAVPGAPLRAFRGVSHAAVPLERAVGMLLDIPLMKRWLFRCQEARSLGREGLVEQVYVAVDGIWPLEDRDVVLRIAPELDAATGTIAFHGTREDGALPKTPGKVRIPELTSSWRLSPTKDGLVRLEWTAHADPNGPAPPWLVNTVSVQVPRYALRRVQAMLDDPAVVGPVHEEMGRACLEALLRAR
jgi:hypothetical protein